MNYKAFLIYVKGKSSYSMQNQSCEQRDNICKLKESALQDFIKYNIVNS